MKQLSIKNCHDCPHHGVYKKVTLTSERTKITVCEKTMYAIYIIGSTRAVKPIPDWCPLKELRVDK